MMPRTPKFTLFPYTTLFRSDDKPTATFFTISYVKKGFARPEDRPLTFVFNGGPGSASIWLHFGLVGPRLIDRSVEHTSELQSQSNLVCCSLLENKKIQ